MPARLAPAAKLTMMDRKNCECPTDSAETVRDEFDAKRPDLEKRVSDLLGASWTIDIDPKNIAPYHTDSTANQLGTVLN